MADHAHDTHGDYHRGDMDIHEQAATYAFVMKLTKWGSLATAVAILMLALWFCTDVGFLGGLVTGLVLTVLGVVLLREKKSGGH
jgi:thiamine transporter ThiT